MAALRPFGGLCFSFFFHRPLGGFQRVLYEKLGSLAGASLLSCNPDSWRAQDATKPPTFIELAEVPIR